MIKMYSHIQTKCNNIHLYVIIVNFTSFKSILILGQLIFISTVCQAPFHFFPSKKIKRQKPFYHFHLNELK